jgi:hypothetical protein
VGRLVYTRGKVNGIWDARKRWQEQLYYTPGIPFGYKVAMERSRYNVAETFPIKRRAEQKGPGSPSIKRARPPLKREKQQREGEDGAERGGKGAERERERKWMGAGKM